MKPTTSPNKTAWRSFLIIIAIIFLVETMVMGLFSLISSSAWTQTFSDSALEMFVDSTLLIIFLFPPLYYFMLRPMEQEIAERKQTEEALRKSQETLSLFMRYSPIYAYIKEVTSTESRVAQASDNYQQMVGVQSWEITGKTMEELFPAEFAAKTTTDDWAVVSSGQVLKLDEDLNGRNYTTIKFPIPQNGKILLAGYTIDITERKQAEEALRESETRFRNIFEKHSAVMLIIEPATGEIINVNRAAETFYGYPMSRLCKMNIAEINMFPPDQVQLERQRALHEERNYFIFPHRLADGSVRTVEVHSSPIVIEDKTLLFSIIHDITERKQAEEKIYLQNLALKTASHAVVVTDKDGAVQWANQAWCELTGYSENEVIGKNMRILKSGKQDETFYKSLWNTILAGEVWRGELTNKRKDGELYVEEQTITPVLDEQGDVKNFIAIKQDITERKQMEDELRELGTRDALTGLYNRRYFEEEMARQERGRLFPISLIMADVDGLKKINDQRGHDVGDEHIKRVAQLLVSAFRAEDVVARIGGDEFAALLPNSDAKAAESTLVRVRQILQEYNASHAGPSISLSLGVSSAEKSTPLSIILKRADVNMYREKRRKDDDSSSAQK